MPKRTLLLLSGLVVALVSAAHADAIPSNYEAFNYQATVLPAAATPAWTKTQTGGTESIIGGNILDGDTYTGNTGKQLYYYRVSNTGTNLDRGSAEGYVVSFSAAIPQCENSIVTRNRLDAGFVVGIQDINSSTPDGDSQTYYVGIDTGRIGVSSGFSTALQSYVNLSSEIYNANNQNVFDIVRIGDTLTVYLNGILRLTVANLATTATTPEVSRLYMGDMATSYDVHFQLAYIKGGNIVPEPATLTLACGGLVVTMLSSRRKKMSFLFAVI